MAATTATATTAGRPVLAPPGDRRCQPRRGHDRGRRDGDRRPVHRWGGGQRGLGRRCPLRRQRGVVRMPVDSVNHGPGDSVASGPAGITWHVSGVRLLVWDVPGRDAVGPRRLRHDHPGRGVVTVT